MPSRTLPLLILIFGANACAKFSEDTSSSPDGAAFVDAASLAMPSFETANANTASCGEKDCFRTEPMAAPAGALVFGFAFGEAAAVRKGTDFTVRDTRDENISQDRIVKTAGPVVVTASPDAPSPGASLGLVLRAR